jgi:hypothetical protein
VTEPTRTEFLLARIAEDERAARGTAEPFYEREAYSRRFDSFESDHSDGDREFVDRFNPTRVLAECEAKRRIVDLTIAAEQSMERLGDMPTIRALEEGRASLGREMCRALAAVYSDHPDYRQEWKP